MKKFRVEIAITKHYTVEAMAEDEDAAQEFAVKSQQDVECAKEVILTACIEHEPFYDGRESDTNQVTVTDVEDFDRVMQAGRWILEEHHAVLAALAKT
jgi:hypothetical protein